MRLSRPSWTAREYLGYFAALRQAQDEVEGLLETGGLAPEWRKRPMGTYSTGMKRRVELARALLGSPRVLFLDEPTRGLDLPAKRDTWELLRRLAKEEGVTIFLSSHDVMEILALCGEVTVLAKGRVSFRGKLRTLGATPQRLQQALIDLLEGKPAPPTAARTRPAARRN